MTVEQQNHRTPDGRHDSAKSMPGSAGLPLLGFTYSFATGRLTASHRMYNRFGPVYWNKSLGQTWVNVETPEACGAVLQDRDRAFDASGWSLLIGPFFHRGLMLLDGHEHHGHRRIMQGAFTAQKLAGYLEPMNETIRAGLERWKPGRRRFYPAVKQLTLDVATHTFMDADAGAEADRLNRAFVDAVRAGTALVRFPVPGLRWAKGLAGSEGARGLPATADSAAAGRRRHRPVQRAVPGAGRGRPGLRRPRHRQSHDLPADGRPRHRDDHDDLHGLLPGQAPGVAAALLRRVRGARRGDHLRRARLAGRARPG